MFKACIYTSRVKILPAYILRLMTLLFASTPFAFVNDEGICYIRFVFDLVFF